MSINDTYFSSTILHISPKKALIQTISNIVYAQKSTLDYENVPLYMDIWRPKGVSQLPVVLFVTGGGFIASNRARLPQLRMFLAEAGYCVSTISYRVTPESIFPAPIEDVKSAIRYLKAHSNELNINPDKISVVGDSAGGYLASFVGVTNGITEFDKGDNLYVSSSIQAAVNLYGPTDLSKKAEGLSDEIKTQYASAASTTSLFINGIPGFNIKNFDSSSDELMRRANPINYIHEKSAPMLLMHGEKDQVVSPNQTDILYQALRRKGIEAYRYIIPEAGHASHIGSHWIQDEVLNVILDFLDKMQLEKI